MRRPSTVLFTARALCRPQLARPSPRRASCGYLSGVHYCSGLVHYARFPQSQMTHASAALARARATLSSSGRSGVTETWHSSIAGVLMSTKFISLRPLRPSALVRIWPSQNHQVLSINFTGVVAPRELDSLAMNGCRAGLSSADAASKVEVVHCVSHLHSTEAVGALQTLDTVATGVYKYPPPSPPQERPACWP